MAIELKDIRTAVRVYLNTKVAGSISTLRPDVLNTLNPNEGFTFSVTATNAASADGGIALSNVRYHLIVNDSHFARLTVPPTTIAITRAVSRDDGPPLSPGTLVKEMFLFPVDHALPAGDTDTISGLKGKAGVEAGSTRISLDILADPDLEFIFPRNENSATADRRVDVV
jgi:hypothetical protein